MNAHASRWIVTRRVATAPRALLMILLMTPATRGAAEPRNETRTRGATVGFPWPVHNLLWMRSHLDTVGVGGSKPLAPTKNLDGYGAF